MITICKIKEEDLKKIETILEEKNIDIKNIKENYLAVYDKDNILGFGGYDLLNNIAVLKVIDIFDKNMENILKDGLIKSLLNLADINGIRIFMIKKDKNISFYKNIGFVELDNRDFILNLDINEEEYIYINLLEFFKNPCKGNKHI
ncbi:hypothetical protein [Tepidibacter formicigenes]|jgi:citrate lyase synthetase|uniref:N-acetyltransferase domain-containing protein n=1 Tax=Tepidibacter formicigenes DSM 15518 TaxID=1123349 RepID=A0A1M6M9B5_9FIRM|nr:hypothetical protein [Tepidibacter formicigenes]SHJ80039.1 hypothetical protein SAMN02744037_00864 [Tepidibacter formicigenes DSM 15518]